MTSLLNIVNNSLCEIPTLTMDTPQIIEDFYGVYLLYCINPKYKGRTYIGYTRDPNRRIKQHNRGTWAGGANRTSHKGPWKMVLIIHGFPNNISALRFEWAWQNPNTTTRLQHLNLKRIPRKETEYKFKLRILSEMLRVGPWSRLPLTVRWLEKDFYEEFDSERTPPTHMTICTGAIKSKNLKKNTVEKSLTIEEECLICSRYIREFNSKLTCLNPDCELVCHITCLADLFILPGDYVPIEGQCPFCQVKLKWGDLIRKIKGCCLNEKAIIVASNEKETDDDGNENDDDKDDEILCTQDKGFVDNNSWFLDCNDVL